MRVLATTAGLAVAGLAAAAAVAAPAAPPVPHAHFAVKGDWGDGSRTQALITRRMCGEARRVPFDLVVTTGDNFYPAGRATTANFWRPERCLRALGVRWRAAWGNHDVPGTGTARALGSPRRHYAFSAGPARIIVLDGNDPADPAQRRFLAGQLARTPQPVRIVVTHQPLRTAGLHPPSDAARRAWEPIMRRGGVSLVLQGHNHLYERIAAGGITYVTTGGGGGVTYPCLRPAAGLRRCAIEPHFLLVDVGPRAIALRAVTPRGRTIERVRIPVPVPD